MTRIFYSSNNQKQALSSPKHSKKLYYGTLETIPEEQKNLPSYNSNRISIGRTSFSYDDNGNDDDDDDESILSSSQRNPFLTYRVMIFMTIAIFFLIHESRQSYEQDQGHENNNNDAVLTSKNNPNVLHYTNQKLDHFDEDDDASENPKNRWSHPYLLSDTYFAGPGNPILVILSGGSGSNDGDILYPFVSHGLAKELKGLVLQIEHRFYGSSQPTSIGESLNRRYLSPEQAMMDVVEVIRHVQVKSKCSLDRSSPDYCAVVTIGASHYLGFLAAMLRLSHPDVVDMGYASSAPMMIEDTTATSNTTTAFWDKVSKVADDAVPGCSQATHDTLKQLYDWILDRKQSGNLVKIASRLGLCSSTLPSDITTRTILAEELTRMVMKSYAESNQNYYPPLRTNYNDSHHDDDDDDDHLAPLQKFCGIFSLSEDTTTAVQRYANFVASLRKEKEECLDLKSKLPNGRESDIFTIDWLSHDDDDVWEFQLCHNDWRIPSPQVDSSSMFYPVLSSNYSLWVQHCQQRFQVTPSTSTSTTTRLWNNYLSSRDNNNSSSSSTTTTTSTIPRKKILFTNGMNDGWSVFSSPSVFFNNDDDDDTVVILNFPNGAHHSELQQSLWPPPLSDDDTPDIIEGYQQIITLMKDWLSYSS